MSVDETSLALLANPDIIESEGIAFKLSLDLELDPSATDEQQAGGASDSAAAAAAAAAATAAEAKNGSGSKTRRAYHSSARLSAAYGMFPLQWWRAGWWYPTGKPLTLDFKIIWRSGELCVETEISPAIEAFLSPSDVELIIAATHVLRAGHDGALQPPPQSRPGIVSHQESRSSSKFVLSVQIPRLCIDILDDSRGGELPLLQLEFQNARGAAIIDDAQEMDAVVELRSTLSARTFDCTRRQEWRPLVDGWQWSIDAQHQQSDGMLVVVCDAPSAISCLLDMSSVTTVGRIDALLERRKQHKSLRRLGSGGQVTEGAVQGRVWSQYSVLNETELDLTVQLEHMEERAEADSVVEPAARQQTTRVVHGRDLPLRFDHTRGTGVGCRRMYGARASPRLFHVGFGGMWRRCENIRPGRAGESFVHVLSQCGGASVPDDDNKAGTSVQQLLEACFEWLQRPDGGIACV